MGYYSYYELEVEGPKEQLEKLTKLLNNEGDWHFPYYEVHRAYFEEHRDSTKWYEYQDDLKRLSLEFPNLLFTLKRSGEETGDLEMSYYKGGKMQVCPAKITFDKYSPSKMV